MTLDEFREVMTEINPDALLADGLEAAILGYTVGHHSEHVVAYDYDKCVEVLVSRDGMTPEEAGEFLSFNTLGAYVGPHGPVYVKVTA